MSEYQNNYPIIICHGLMGYGEQDKLYKYVPHFGMTPKSCLVAHLRAEGYEVYQPSLGPVNCAWDRACVLWAYLFGGTVDFGKAYSEKHGHARYGRTYDHGVLEDLGKTEAHKKINLIGHSFGGPTVKQIAELFANGSEEERQATPPEDLSPLFAGGHGNLLHTVTTLSGVNNGTTLATLLGRGGMTYMTYRILLEYGLVADTPVAQYYDMMIDQWGLMGDPANVNGWHFHNPLKALPGIRKYNANKTTGAVTYEMQVEVVQKYVNPDQHVIPTAYYFAERADGTSVNAEGQVVPDKKKMSGLCFLSAQATTRYQPKKLAQYGVGSDDWKKNDGFVNLTGQSAPLNAPSEEADENTEFKPGIWYNMPPRPGDHLIWIGIPGPREAYFKMFDDMIDRFRRLPDGESVNS